MKAKIMWTIVIWLLRRYFNSLTPEQQVAFIEAQKSLMKDEPVQFNN
jgi:hypothetical protein